MTDLSLIEKEIGYTFTDKNLLLTAFTHASFSNENNATCNQRLEFLGDAVLEYIVSMELYTRYPEKREDFLTDFRKRIVSGKVESQAFSPTNLIKEMRFGVNAVPTDEKGLLNVYEDLFEALVGAIYLDGGIENCRRFIFKYLGKALNDPEIQSSAEDYKSTLISLCQKNKWTCVFKEDAKTGPPHNPIFECHVEINNQICGNGQGRSKKDAEQMSAKVALKGFKSVD